MRVVMLQRVRDNRNGSWYTEGAELEDESSSGQTEYDTDEEDRALYAAWHKFSKVLYILTFV